VLLLIASLNCAWRGWQLQQPLMVAISLVGFATVATNLWFCTNPIRDPWTGSRNTSSPWSAPGSRSTPAFFAFGAVRLLPEMALTPALWSVPLITGLTLIIYHQRAVTLRFVPARRTA
jgi:hypothetical protein